MIYLKNILSLVALVLILSLPFWLKLYAVRGHSMEPVLQSGDVALVDTLSAGFSAPRRGELMVFNNPHGKEAPVGGVEIDIKRVIGLPQETVHVRHDRIVINRACADPSVPQGQQVAIQPQDGPCQTTFATSTFLGGGSVGGNGNEFDMYLGPEDYFVLGDNRRDSSDSRYFGAIQKSDFIGRALVRVWPWSQMKWLESRILK